MIYGTLLAAALFLLWRRKANCFSLFFYADELNALYELQDEKTSLRTLCDLLKYISILL